MFTQKQVIELINRIRNYHTLVYEHSFRTAAFAVTCARIMGLRRRKIQYIYYGMLLHDMGKIYVPKEVLNKPDKLTILEQNIIHKHPFIGTKIVEKYKPHKDILDIILYHHEHWNGSGYPQRLKGRKIPLTARIAAVADSYDAMTSNRPYRKALSSSQAIIELKNKAGTQFDPEIVDLFCSSNNQDFITQFFIPKNFTERSCIEHVQSIYKYAYKCYRRTVKRRIFRLPVCRTIPSSSCSSIQKKC